MAEVDPRIILGSQQPNFLQNIGQMANVANALLGAQAQKQQIQANVATSEAFKQATNPETGQTDWNQLRGLVAQGPAAYNLPQINQAITQNQVAQQTLEKGRFDLAMQKQQALNDQLGALSQLGPNVTANDVTQRMVDLVQAGVLPTEVAVGELGKMPKSGPELQQWIKQHQFTAMKGMERLQAMNPNFIQVSDGQNTYLVNTNTQSSIPYGVAGQFRQQLTPAQLAETVMTKDETGAPVAMTKGQLLQMPGGGGIPGAAPEGYTGRYGSPQGGTPGQVGVKVGPSPNEELNMAGATKLAQDAAANAEGAPRRINILTQMQQALRNPNIDTGPGSEWRNQVKAYITSLAPGVSKSFGTMENVTDMEEFAKLANQFANQQSAGMGSGTNDRLNIALTGNANPKITKASNLDIIAKVKALEKMDAAKNYAWQQAVSGANGEKVDPGKYKLWSAEWNNKVSPEVFIADELAPEQYTKMRSRMTQKEKDKFDLDYYKAHKAGLVGQ